MKYCKTALAILAAVSVSLALADDFKTNDGKEYKNATVRRVEPDGIVVSTKGGISKLYFTELPKEVQERFHYNPASVAAQSSRQNANATPTSAIEDLPPITIELRDEMLNALKLTDKLDALYKGGCRSTEFIAAATPIEGVFMKLQFKLPKADPRRDLLANSFEAYQQAAVAMTASERAKSERPDAIIVAAGLRKHLLTKILEGNVTPEEEKVYYAWRKATKTTP